MKSLNTDHQWLCNALGKFKGSGFNDLPLPSLSMADDAYANFIQANQLGAPERFMISLAFVQFFKPDCLAALLDEYNSYRLVQCNKTGLLLPTGETFLKLWSGNDPEKKIEAHAFFEAGHVLYKKGVLQFGEVNEGLAAHYGILKISPTYRDLFLYNRFTRPRFSTEFPAHLLETSLEWEDLIISQNTADRLGEVRDHLMWEQKLRAEWGLGKHMREGYRCLFHGPSGTGKSLAATLMGKYLGRDVYRVDLSAIVSKYIGETSKNLNALFNNAEDKDWILFFDEGDAIFGKRIDTQQSEDKNAHYANQDTAFLLQRIENYRGLVVVATNFRNNLDEAFVRRFQSIVNFAMQNEADRLRVWKMNLPQNCRLEPTIDLSRIAKEYKIPAASILNVIQHVSLLTIRKSSTEILACDLEKCLKDEIYK